ncbi:MAG: hypothetical protein QOF09_2781 [Alphaproteobacteria bacterium]|jgi:hypothetical protein|nr:hypothetical protein [Alphaproteobacteria bacterium]
MATLVTGSAIEEGSISTVSWGAVIAGGIAAAAVSLVLLAFGIGVGFSVVSPWADQGVSSTTFAVGAGIYLVVVAMLSSTVGGYLAGRLRNRWAGVHNDEVYFRDTAHGFLAWAFATVLGATVLGAATTHILAGASAGLIPAAGASAGMAASNPTDSYVDTLLRTDTAPGTPANPSVSSQPAPASDQAATRAELGRLVASSMRKGGDLSATDRTYIARVVSARTGLSQAESEKRVNDVIAQAKKAADDARKAAAKLSLWLAASLLAGALASTLAATEGGLLRDSPWYEAGWRPGPFGAERSPR